MTHRWTKDEKNSTPERPVYTHGDFHITCWEILVDMERWIREIRWGLVDGRDSYASTIQHWPLSTPIEEVLDSAWKAVQKHLADEWAALQERHFLEQGELSSHIVEFEDKV